MCSLKFKPVFAARGLKSAQLGLHISCRNKVSNDQPSVIGDLLKKRQEGKIEIVQITRLCVIEVKSLSHREIQNRRIRARNVSVIVAIIGTPILLALSTIAASSYPAIQLVYAQGRPTNGQEGGNNLTFQTTDVTLDGTSYPVKYNITDNAAEVLSIVPDRESFKLVTTIAPTKDGKLTVMIPRNLTDYKVAGGKDGKFLVNINAREITNFQETSNNQTTRGLEINFGKDDRVIEIVGTQMGQGDIATVTEQANQTTPTTGAENVSQAGANVSQTGSSIVNQTGEAAQSFVNKTTSFLGNITGGVLGN